MSILAAESKRPVRLKMIERALKEQAPKMYRQLKEAGNLKAFLKDHEAQMMESYLEELHQVQSRALDGKNAPKDYLERLQMLTMGMNTLWENTLATWLTFSDSPTIDM